MEGTAKIYDLRSRQPIAANDSRIATPASSEPNAASCTRSRNLASVAFGKAWWLFCFIFFHLLNWPSGLIRGLLGLATILSLVALLIVGLGMHDAANKTRMLWSLGGFSFACAAFLWCYDVLLFKLQAVIFKI